MTRYSLLIGSAALLMLTLSSAASAQSTSGIHVVRPSETLASIAQLYYGDPRRENVLVAENGLTTHGGAAIQVGMRLVIPAVTYHHVQPGENWQRLSTRFYGEARRAFVLIEANRGSSGSQPDSGAEILVPYPLRHVAEQGDTMTRLATLYYGNSDHSRRLRRFNDVRTNGLTRGQMVLVPLAGLLLSPQGRRVMEEHMGRSLPDGNVRTLQDRIDRQLPTLRAHVHDGEFVEAVSLANRLLGSISLTGNQIVTIQRQLGTAYVALRREDLAAEAFIAALERQRDLELDAMRTSPTVLRVFRMAREQLERQWQPSTDGLGEE